ncbi:MAG: helix-turn-helix transcriptional regulator [Bacteroidota bacterium]
MIISNELLFFFSSLGVFNGIILAVYLLFFTKREELANKFLGLLLLFISIRIGKSVVFFFYRDLGELYRQIGLSACFLIGPTLYYYLRTELGGIKTVPNRWKLSFGFWLSVLLLVGCIYPYEAYPKLWNTRIVSVIYHVWMAYVIVSAWVAKGPLKKMILGPRELNRKEVWVLCIYLGNALVFLAFYLVPYTPYIVGALSFSLVLYLLIFILFFGQVPLVQQLRQHRYNNHKISAIEEETMALQLDRLMRERQLYSNPKLKIGDVASAMGISVHRYNNHKISAIEEETMALQLDRLMRERQLYSNPKLKIGDVASAMGISVHRLSQFLNDNLGQNYSNYINSWRVELAKELIAKHHHLSLEGIGEEAGFSSKSTFYAVFKKTAGLTPAQYRKAVIPPEL